MRPNGPASSLHRPDIDLALSVGGFGKPLAEIVMDPVTHMVLSFRFPDLPRSPPVP